MDRTMPSVFSTRDIADLLGVETWRVRRLFEDGTLPEPGRFAGKRAIPGETIPAIVDALRVRGWLPQKADLQEVTPAKTSRPQVMAPDVEAAR
jgi:hypothetical protein